MRNVLILLFCFGFAADAQTKLPVVRANSEKVSVRDGAFFDKESWTLNPKAKPDVFTADRTRETKYVTFYTDIDSIRVKVKPGSHFDFVILHGKDSCYTRIASAIQDRPMIDKTDTIPFTLTKYSAIAIKTAFDGKDTLTMHLDLSAFGIRMLKSVVKQKNLELKHIHTLQMGTLILQLPTVRSTDITAHEMEGRIGGDIFEGKIVEIDYEKRLILVYRKLPSLKGYRQVPLRFIRSYPCAEISLIVDGKKYKGDFVLDNGSDQNLIIDSLWAAQQHFPTNLKVISTTVLHDPRGRSFESRKVEVPEVQLNSLSYKNVPALLLGSQQPTGFSVNFLGNGLLKAFDMVIDFRHDRLYLKKRV